MCTKSAIHWLQAQARQAGCAQALSFPPLCSAHSAPPVVQTAMATLLLATPSPPSNSITQLARQMSTQHHICLVVGPKLSAAAVQERPLSRERVVAGWVGMAGWAWLAGWLGRWLAGLPACLPACLVLFSGRQAKQSASSTRPGDALRLHCAVLQSPPPCQWLGEALLQACSCYASAASLLQACHCCLQLCNPSLQASRVLLGLKGYMGGEGRGSEPDRDRARGWVREGQFAQVAG